jgi:catechol 2,3-dioxygenase-like lactoylglutathione lyase family enzyme
MTLELRAAPNIGLVAHCHEAMVRFYGEGLGLVKLSETAAPPSPTGASRVAHVFALGDGQLKIWVLDPIPEVAPVAGKMGRTGISYLTLTVGDLSGLVERLTKQGFDIAEPPHRAASGAPLTLGWVRDPDGNWIELVEPDA